jgi:hypothetical protein
VQTLRGSPIGATMVCMRGRLCIVGSSLLSFTLGGCTNVSQNSGTCVPGASVACTCSSGQSGAQTCTAAGTFAACVCATPMPDAGASDLTASVDTERAPDLPAANDTLPAPPDVGAPDFPMAAVDSQLSIDAHLPVDTRPPGCPPNVGNEIGIGKPCTATGAECTGSLQCSCKDWFGYPVPASMPCYCTVLSFGSTCSACGSNASCCTYSIPIQTTTVTVSQCAPTACGAGTQCPSVTQ